MQQQASRPQSLEGGIEARKLAGLRGECGVNFHKPIRRLRVASMRREGDGGTLVRKLGTATQAARLRSSAAIVPSYFSTSVIDCHPFAS